MTFAEDEDIVRALAMIGAEAARMERLGERIPPSGRATFRIATHDGRILKARRASRAEDAARTTTMSRALVGVRAVSVLATTGKVTIESWIEGRVLADGEGAAPHVEQAADLLVALHGTQRVGAEPLDREAGTAAVVEELRARLFRLRKSGALADGDAEALGARALESAPASAAIGVSHDDFCGENLVADANGELWIVDLGALDVGFLDYDLARTRVRWPMPDDAWTAFLACYRRSRPTALSAEHAPFWRIVAAVKSAHHRLRFGLDVARAPLTRLARELETSS